MVTCGWYRTGDGRADNSPGASATIDHSDIRGSEPQGHDPSGAASAKRAGRVRIERRRVLLFVGPSAVIGSAVQEGFTLSSLGLPVLCFGVNGDGPNKAQQLTAERSHDLIFVLAARRQCLVALVQAMLRFPGHLFGFIG